MPLGTEVGFGPGNIVLDRDPAPPKKGTAPPLSVHVLLLSNGWMDQDATWYGVDLCPGHIVSDGAQLPRKMAQQPPSFRPMSIVAKRSPISATAELLLHFA